MADDRLREAIKAQADELKKRVEWLQQMYEKQTKTVHMAQASADQLQTEMQAVNVALGGLRAEYAKLMRNGSKE